MSEEPPSDSMGPTELCEFCNKINFDFLRTPLISDLPALWEDRVDSSRKRLIGLVVDKDRERTTPLGSFADILQRARTCGLCQLVGNAILRHLPDRICDDDEWTTDMTWLGCYRNSLGRQYPVRRLTIFAGDHITITTKALFYAFQPCSIGAASAQADGQFADSRSAPGVMAFGGRRRPLKLDVQWVQNWMDICKADHGMACERPCIDGKRGIETVRFVDVVLMCIITLEDIDLSKHKYLALSYVWGGPPEVKLERRNKDAMARPGALAAESLPNTVSDSMLLAKSLGFRHLWIDALCILQDDNEDKQIQIDAMSQIYGFAFLTVVAASSSGINGGLPGLRPGTRSAVQEEVVVVPSRGPKDGANGETTDHGLSLMTTLQPLQEEHEHYAERAPWNSRGWTMQEGALSRRMLIFTSEQVYWSCREATFCEESYLEDKLLRCGGFTYAPAEQSRQPSLRYWDNDRDPRGV